MNDLDLLPKYLSQIDLLRRSDIEFVKHLDPLRNALFTIALDENTEVGHDARADKDVTFDRDLFRAALRESAIPSLALTLKTANKHLSKRFFSLHIVMRVAEILLLALHFVKPINASL